jgi:hypothetical protein
MLNPFEDLIIQHLNPICSHQARGKETLNNIASVRVLLAATLANLSNNAALLSNLFQ